ncbi:MAG TPA: endonuclease/exonuclease/phosphatase family protein [Opitutus sp.]|nr:endonuclease/exonuclease/phosphatase family protein [Opitutus sp.]
MTTFRLLQFNMQFGQGWDEADPDNAPVNLDATLAEIRRHSPDIVMLQEVEKAQSGGVQAEPPPNFTRMRAALAGYHSWFAYPKADPRELPFGIGLAIFSRAPLRDEMRLDLPSPAIEFTFEGRNLTPTDRLLIGAKTTVLGRDVQLFNTHLLAFFMLGSGSTANPWQRNRIADLLADATGPTLLSGDFNVSRHEGLVAQFASRGFAAVQDTEITWRRRPYVLDHIFYNSPLRAVSRAVIPTAASDHHLLVADFAFA